MHNYNTIDYKWICAVHCLVCNCIFYPIVNDEATLLRLPSITLDYIVLWIAGVKYSRCYSS